MTEVNTDEMIDTIHFQHNINDMSTSSPVTYQGKLGTQYHCILSGNMNNFLTPGSPVQVLQCDTLLCMMLCYG